MTIELIATIELSSDANEVEFLNIPQTYKHLIVKNDFSSSQNRNINFTINGSTALRSFAISLEVEGFLQTGFDDFFDIKNDSRDAEGSSEVWIFRYADASNITLGLNVAGATVPLATGFKTANNTAVSSLKLINSDPSIPWRTGQSARMYGVI